MGRYGLIGEKLGHSFSPSIHKQLWGCDYSLTPVAREEIGEYFRARAFDGINVTIPYKQDAFRACDHTDERAAAIGAVNTVVNRGGVLYGYNTDYDGFLYCAARAGVEFAGKKVLILGSGGTSLTARTAAADAGASRITVISRSARPSKETEAGISHRCPLTFDTYDALAERHKDARIIVNTTPVGMFPNNYASPVDLSLFPHLEGVIDVIFNPGVTMLVYQARRMGIPATCGLPMLVAQAAFAAQHFTGRSFSREEVERVLRSVRAQTSDIVLIGMPGCGKSTVARLLADRLNRPVSDTDAMVVQAENRPIPEIFARDGESYFRRKETEAVMQAGKQTGIILSCGGGVPLREENHFPLLQNGRVYFLQRELDRLATKGRPLSANRADLPEMYRNRLPLYRSLCHREFAVTEGDPSAAAGKILEDFYEHIGD